MRIRQNIGPYNYSRNTYEYAWSPSGGYGSPIRTRSLESLSVSNKVWTTPSGYRQFAEYMEDDIGVDGRFRPCLHTFESHEFDAPVVLCDFYNSCATNQYVRKIGVTQITAAASLRPVPDVDMNAMANEALAYMLPRINEGLSVINFALELRDLKRMDPRGSLERIRRRSLPLRALRDPKTRKQFMKELSHRLTSAHLGASFGIVPFVGDIVQAHDDIQRLEHKLRLLKRFAGRPVVRHYKRVIPESAGIPAMNDWVIESAPPISFGYWDAPDHQPDLDGQYRDHCQVTYKARWVQRPVYHATMRYIYSVPRMTAIEEKLATYMDVLGLRLDPGIVWDATRYSFLIDWVVDVSGFLHSFARDNWPIEVNILDFCHSMAWSKEVMIDVGFNSRALAPLYYPPQQPFKVVNVYRSLQRHYNRVLHKPDIHSARVRAPKLRQAALAGSLLLNKKRTWNSTKYLDLSRLPSGKRVLTQYGVRRG